MDREEVSSSDQFWEHLDQKQRMFDYWMNVAVRCVVFMALIILLSVLVFVCVRYFITPEWTGRLIDSVVANIGIILVGCFFVVVWKFNSVSSLISNQK